MNQNCFICGKMPRQKEQPCVPLPGMAEHARLRDSPSPSTHVVEFSKEDVARMIFAGLAQLEGIAIPFGKGAQYSMTVTWRDDGSLRVAVTFTGAKGRPTLRVIRGGKLAGKGEGGGEAG